MGKQKTHITHNAQHTQLKEKKKRHLISMRPNKADKLPLY